MIVVSDTSPLCYLLVIEGIEVLPQLFGRVIIPQRVRDELLAPVLLNLFKSGYHSRQIG